MPGRANSRNATKEKVVLMVGACGLDRLLSVHSHPAADTKIGTNSYHEVGGGNAANTASAMAILSTASFIGGEKIVVKLLSKLGRDRIQEQLSQELEAAGVDLSSPLFIVKEGATTSFTTVIVSESEQTRTCIHTPGTCGELTMEDVRAANLDEVFHNVVHVHSDCRHTEAAVELAREASRRSIRVSVDAEKDRHTPAMDDLMGLVDLLFTNQNQLNDYTCRRNRELEQQMQVPSLLPISIINQSKVSNVEPYVRAAELCHFLHRWNCGKPDAGIVVTRGDKGAFRLMQRRATHELVDNCRATNQISARQADCKLLLQQIVQSKRGGVNEDIIKSWSRDTCDYMVHRVGVLKDPEVVDTTGAGDAFIGGYLLNLIAFKSEQDEDEVINFSLRFGAWIAGKKLAGPGARTALPSGNDVDTELGKDRTTITATLEALLTPLDT